MDVGSGEKGGNGIVGYGDDFYGGERRRIEHTGGVGMREEEREVIGSGKGEAFAHGHKHSRVVRSLSRIKMSI